MFDEPFRRAVDGWMRPLAAVLARLGVRPDHVTAIAFLLALAAAALIAFGRPVSGLAVWLVSRIGDGLDGALARETAAASAFGGYLDITLDMTAYSAIVIGFAIAHPSQSVGWAAVLAGYVVVITTTLALSDASGRANRQISRTDRTFQFTPGLTEAGETSVMYALWTFFPAYLPFLVWVWVAALLATGVQRTILAWRVLR
jgi:phosphatidylglycerophosphate synthase